VHAGEHTKCNWCDKATAPVQSPKASRPKASQSVNTVWATPTVKWGNWLQVNDRPRRSGKLFASPTPTWNQWSALSDEEADEPTSGSPDDGDESDVHTMVAPEGPSEADHRKEAHALAVAARNAIAGMPGAEQMVEDFDIQIQSMRHAIHKDKPPKEQLRVAWLRKSRAEASRDKAIAQAAASSTAYSEAGRIMMIAQDKEKESIASCEAAIDYYNQIESNYESEEAWDTWKPSTPGPTGKAVHAMSQQELDNAITASSLAHSQLLAASAAMQEDSCKMQLFSVATPTSPCSAPKTKVRSRSPASTSADSIMIDDSPARSICRTDAYQPEDCTLPESVPPDTVRASISYGKAITQVARTATPYGDSMPPTPGGASQAMREEQAGTSSDTVALFGEAPHLGEVRFATEAPQ
jgi:hypothetical protein